MIDGEADEIINMDNYLKVNSKLMQAPVLNKHHTDKNGQRSSGERPGRLYKASTSERNVLKHVVSKTGDQETLKSVSPSSRSSPSIRIAKRFGGGVHQNTFEQ